MSRNEYLGAMALMCENDVNAILLLLIRTMQKILHGNGGAK